MAQLEQLWCSQEMTRSSYILEGIFIPSESFFSNRILYWIMTEWRC
jgi:hypothetical protein